MRVALCLLVCTVVLAWCASAAPDPREGCCLSVLEMPCVSTVSYSFNQPDPYDEGSEPTGAIVTNMLTDGYKMLSRDYNGTVAAVNLDRPDLKASYELILHNDANGTIIKQECTQESLTPSEPVVCFGKAGSASAFGPTKYKGVLTLGGLNASLYGFNDSDVDMPAFSIAVDLSSCFPVATFDVPSPWVANPDFYGDLDPPTLIGNFTTNLVVPDNTFDVPAACKDAKVRVGARRHRGKRHTIRRLFGVL